MSALMLPRRPLGRTGLAVSPLGLAELYVPSTGLGGPRLTSDEVERAFHEHGVNAFLVGPSRSALSDGVRRLIGSGHRDELVIVAGAALPFAGSVRRAMEKQQRMLGTDRIDVFLLGYVRKRWYFRASVLSEMQRLRERGLVRALGFSSHDRVLAAALARELPVDVMMIRYNASHRGAEREVFAPLEALGDGRAAVVAYTATRWGLLLQPLPARGFARGMSAPECYRFTLGHPMVDMAWCAARTPGELAEDVAGVLAGPLDPVRREEVCRFGDAVHGAARFGRRWMFGRQAA